MYEIIFYVGLGIFIIGGIGLLIAAFRTSILWGLAILLIAPVAILYLIVHWQDAKGPFKLQVLGVLIIAVFTYMNNGTTFPTSASSIMSGANVSNSASSIMAGASVSTFADSIGSSTNMPNQQFICDGRQHCSQMHSRAEAEFFLQNCPNTKMDGDRDGVPCENDTRF